MSCEEYREQLVSYVCGELTQLEGQQLGKHLEVCDACRTVVSEFGAIEGLVQRLPVQEYNDKLRIRDLLRQRARARTFVLSKAALWIFLILGVFSMGAFLPVHWEISSGQLSVRWGSASAQREEELVGRLQKMQQQLNAIERENRDWQSASEVRVRQLLDKNNVDQQKRFFQTMQMFSEYVQVQRKADMQHIKRDIAVNYDRTGQEVQRTNQMLENVLRISATTDNGGYVGD